MIYVLHRLAEQDLGSAFEFYKTNGSVKVALRFIAEFERVAELLANHPEMGTPMNEGRRSFPFRKYPYSLIYRPMDGGVRILAVRHQRREPGFGGGRT